jgi:hypothetical protein
MPVYRGTAERFSNECLLCGQRDRAAADPWWSARRRVAYSAFDVVKALGRTVRGPSIAHRLWS